jgi:hypothetical protein
MKFSLRHPYSIEPEAFWRDVFFDPAYNEALYREALHFEAFKVLEETSPADGRRTRKLAVKPKIDAPGPIKAMLGDSVDYVEDGRLDPSRRAWITKVIPSKLADKSASAARCGSSGPGRVSRTGSPASRSRSRSSARRDLREVPREDDARELSEGRGLHQRVAERKGLAGK